MSLRKRATLCRIPSILGLSLRWIPETVHPCARANSARLEPRKPPMPVMRQTLTCLTLQFNHAADLCRIVRSKYQPHRFLTIRGVPQGLPPLIDGRDKLLPLVVPGSVLAAELHSFFR